MFEKATTGGYRYARNEDIAREVACFRVRLVQLVSANVRSIIELWMIPESIILNGGQAATTKNIWVLIRMNFVHQHGMCDCVLLCVTVCDWKSGDWRSFCVETKCIEWYWASSTDYWIKLDENSCLFCRENIRIYHRVWRAAQRQNFAEFFGNKNLNIDSITTPSL